MFKRPILTIFFASLTFVVSVVAGMANNQHVQVTLFNKELTPESGVELPMHSRIDPEAFDGDETTLDENTVIGKYGEWTYCQYEEPESPVYQVELQNVEVQEAIQPGEVFLVDVTFKNTGNARLYSQDSECYEKPILNLGTQKEQDRTSVFGTSDRAISGWASPGRVKMSDTYADPDAIFHMQFQSLAPEGDNVYREFFQPVLEETAWLGTSFGFDIAIGNPTDQMKDDISFVTDVSIAASQLSGLQRSLEITLADQTMYAKFGDIVVWSMKISSGAWDTPTPRGTYKILTKQELRIGSKSPHYRMPYFQLWQSSGYGIHALPYLANDGGSFWSEALSHIGIPVSHGCVRMLSEDAITAYHFTSIGTPVVIK